VVGEVDAIRLDSVYRAYSVMLPKVLAMPNVGDLRCGHLPEDSR